MQLASNTKAQVQNILLYFEYFFLKSWPLFFLLCVLFPKCSGVKDKEQSGYLSFWNQVVRLFVIPCDCQTKGVKKSVLVEISDDKAILGVGLPQH